MKNYKQNRIKKRSSRPEDDRHRRQRPWDKIQKTIQHQKIQTRPTQQKRPRCQKKVNRTHSLTKQPRRNMNSPMTTKHSFIRSNRL